jgi:hypothetical protein
MKLAKRLLKESNRNPEDRYYNQLIKELHEEACEGGKYKVIVLNSEHYNTICQRLIKNGFTVMIYNFNPENTTYLTYIIWDKEFFDKNFAENTEMKDKPVHYGLV